MSTQERRELADRLNSASVHLGRYLRARRAETGLGPAQESVLALLVFGGPRSLRQLARAEGVSAPAMTRTVAGLVARRLVTRRRDQQDGRRSQVMVTRAARAAVAQGRRERRRNIEALLAAFSAKEARALMPLVRKLDASALAAFQSAREAFPSRQRRT